MRIVTLSTLFQFLLWCLSIQKSRQAAMSRTNPEPFLAFPLGDSHTGTTRFGTLHNKASGKYVRIVSRHHIDAKADQEDPDALLILRTINFNEMVIQGNSSKYYLCVSSRGELVARKRRKERGFTCSFSEHISQARYNEYRVHQHPGWLLGFKGNGEPKKAQKNRSDHKSTRFLFDPAFQEEENIFNRGESIFNEIFNAVVQKDKRLRKISAERESSRRTLEDSHR